MNRGLIAALVALSFARPVCGQSAEPAPGLTDFAYSAQVVIDEQADAYAVTLSPRVYRDLVSDELSDIRVFNGQAEAVPHGIRSVPPPSVASAPRGGEHAGAARAVRPGSGLPYCRRDPR